MISRKIYSSIFIVMLSLVSCESFLEVAPRNELSDENYWSSEQDAYLSLVGVYDLWGGQGVGEDGFGYSFFLYFADSWSDDGFNQFGGWYESFGQGNISPADAELASRYAELYQIIRRCNVFLANIDRVDMDQELKNQFSAEVRFVRAYEYFVIYHHWGEAQIVKEPLSTDNVSVARGGEGETFQFILEDLDFAIDNLPPIAPEEGRFTQGAAMGLKSRLLLYEASPLINATNDIVKWQEAAKAAKDLIDQQVFELFRTDNGNGYSELFDTQNENNPEVVIDREHDDILNHGNQMVRLLSTTPSATTFLVPSQSLVDAYDTYDESTDALIAEDPSRPFDNRDPRLDFTVGHEGSDFYGSTLSLDTSPLEKSVTGYSIMKFLTDEFDPSNANNGGLDAPVNHILMRYAEVLLNYAEAKIEANDIDASVLNAVNDVRSRAYGVGVGDVSQYPEVTTQDQSELRQIVRNERRVELAMEGLRWYDIRRWEQAEIVRNQTISGARGDIIQRAFEADRDYYWPIPQREIDLIGTDVLVQNPNY